MRNSFRDWGKRSFRALNREAAFNAYTPLDSRLLFYYFHFHVNDTDVEDKVQY